MTKTLFIANLISTLFMTGAIWLIQLVQYPFFASVGTDQFPKYHASHSFWITPIVAPMMISELVTSVFLVVFPPPNIEPKLIQAGLILTVLIWFSTVFLQIPMHEKLAQGFDAQAHRFLVNSNWIRTAAWSLRSIIVVYMLWKIIRFN
jgi:hypothetical protein